MKTFQSDHNKPTRIDKEGIKYVNPGEMHQYSIAAPIEYDISYTMQTGKACLLCLAVIQN